MADYTVSITNAVNCFGPAPSTKWGTHDPYTMVWGSFKWGEGTEDLVTHYEKRLTSETLTLSDAIYKNANKLLDNSIAATSETTMESLQTGNGYYYVFTGPVTDAENRNLSTYTSQTAQSTTYTSASVASTTWS